MSPQQEPRSTWDLEAIPESESPTHRSIATKVQQRRRRRRATISVSAFVFFAIGGFIRWSLNTDQVDLPRTAVIEQTAINSPSVGKVNNITDSAPHTIADSSPRVATDADFTVYANIRADAPVFQFDDQQGVMVPIGWLRSTQTVPVDLGSMSREEIQTFQTILENKPPRFLL